MGKKAQASESMDQSMNNIETTQIQPPKLTKIKIENMNGDQVSYKVTLLFKQEKDEKTEVRRFVVPQDCSTSMVYLKEKLRPLFGKQLENGMKITWRDEDGDDVSIESDEELLIALHEMKGPLYKLSVTACHQDPIKLTGTPQADHVQAVGAEVHPGVMCDACDGPVVGHRYKCLKCLDFDLCSKCEAKGFHPGHNMMRIATPETVWPRHFFNRLNKMQTRASKINEAKNDASKPNAEGANDSDEKTSDNAGAGWGRGRGHFRGPRGGCQRGSGGSVPPFWMPPAGNHFDLMNIGQAVRAALDPFGVDVDVSIETPAKKPRSERDTEMDQAQKEKVDKAREAKEDMTTKAAESSLPKDDFGQLIDDVMEIMEPNKAPKTVEKEAKAVKTNLENPNPDVEMVNVGVKAMEITEKPLPKPVQEEAPKIPEESKDTDEDWTVLDQTSPNMSHSASAI